MIRFDAAWHATYPIVLEEATDLRTGMADRSAGKEQRSTVGSVSNRYMRVSREGLSLTGVYHDVPIPKLHFHTWPVYLHVRTAHECR